jgi:molybdopterin-guanine dinucleotide biosynthesis protein A
MLAQAKRILERAGVSGVVVSGAPNHSRAVADCSPDLGPLGGLASVLQQQPNLAGHCLIVLPIDMPAINPRALTRLAEIAEFHGRGARFDLGPLPLALMNSPDLPGAINDALQAGGALDTLANTLGLPVLASLPDDGLDNPASLNELDQIRQRVDSERAAASS